MLFLQRFTATSRLPAHTDEDDARQWRIVRGDNLRSASSLLERLLALHSRTGCCSAADHGVVEVVELLAARLC